MGLKSIPKDNEYFKYFNNNPKGLHQSDCIVRAVANVLDREYVSICMELAELQCDTGLADIALVDKYMSMNGFVKMKRPNHSDGRQYRGYEFVKSPIASCRRRILANIGVGHITSIIDGKINDIWDCSGKCIGNYWIKIDSPK